MGKPRTSKPTPVEPPAEAAPAPLASVAVLPATLPPAPWHAPAGAPMPEGAGSLIPAPVGAPAWLSRFPEADSGKALFEVAERPMPPRPPARPRADGKPPEYTAVYRLYRADDELLYVGMSNAPLERFIEHRDTKAWWPEVATYSIEWFMARSEAEDAETSAIKDEWPVHNIAHQPRTNGAFAIPSYIVERLVADVLSVVTASVEGATGEQLDQIQAMFRTSFDPGVFPNNDIWFMESVAPDERVPQDVGEVVKALGSFRPPIACSTRVAVPSEAPAPPVASGKPTYCGVPMDLIRMEVMRWETLALNDPPASSTALQSIEDAIANHSWLKIRAAGTHAHKAALGVLQSATDKWLAADDSTKPR